MGTTMQSLIAALLVVVSAGYATWRLMSARKRLELIERLFAHGTEPRARWLVRLRAALAADAARSCGGCAGSAPLARGPRRARPRHE